MKWSIAKTVLLLAVFGGVGFALFLYDKALSILSKVVDAVGYNWVSISIIFVISIFLAVLCFRAIGLDIKNTNKPNELNLTQILKSFIGGVIICYSRFVIAGVLGLIALMVITKVAN
jgi:hypothetical protein